MTRTALVLAVGLALVVITAPHASQIVVREAPVTVGGPPGGRGGAKPMAMGTGLIVGQAVEADSTRPIAGVLVTLGLPGAAPLRALADGEGRFAFRDLPKGRYSISISKAGYVDGAYGRVRPGGPTLPLDLDEGQRLGGITIPIWKYAAVTGFVLDEHSEPIIGAQVRVLKRSIVGGQWRLVPGPTDLTDDRGAYRIGALEPGEYVVAVPMSQNSGMSIDSIAGIAGGRDVVTYSGAVQMRVAATAAAAGGAAPMRLETMISGDAAPPPDENGRPQAYPTQFFPAAATSARAAAVTVGSGEERSGVDFQLKPVRTMRVAGTLAGPDGPAGNMPVVLVPAEAGDLVSPIETIAAFSDASGNFSFGAVPAGQYILRASRVSRGMPAEFVSQGAGGMVTVRAVSIARGGQPPLPTEPMFWAEATVAVETTDIDDLVVALRPGLKVTGQVQFDGATPRPPNDQLSAISVWLEPANPVPGSVSNNIRGRVDPSGQFETMGVPPGHYFVRVGGAPQNWYFRGAMAGGRDVSDVPLEIDSGDTTGVMLTFTDRSTDLSGQVTNLTSGDAATVIIFPADSSAWVGYGSTTRRLRSVRADSNGNYTAQNLPPGDYLVAAVPDKVAGDWQNPKFLESLAASAARVRIAAGDKLTQNVQVSR